MTGATMGPEEGIDGAGVLPAGAAGEGALAPGVTDGAAPAGRWLPQPAIDHALTSTMHAGRTRRRDGVGAYMAVVGEKSERRLVKQSARPWAGRSAWQRGPRRERSAGSRP